MSDRSRRPLEDAPVPRRSRLAALWTSVMFCYVYGDIFDLFRAERIQAILAGRTPIGQTTQWALLGFAVMMSVPALMTALSLWLGARLVRLSNIVMGIVYASIVAATVPGSWMFNYCLAAIEIALTLGISLAAWRWPAIANTESRT